MPSSAEEEPWRGRRRRHGRRSRAPMPARGRRGRRRSRTSACRRGRRGRAGAGSAGARWARPRPPGSSPSATCRGRGPTRCWRSRSATGEPSVRPWRTPPTRVTASCSKRIRGPRPNPRRRRASSADDVVDGDGEPGGQALDDDDEGTTVRLAGGEEPKHGQRVYGTTRDQPESLPGATAGQRASARQRPSRTHASRPTVRRPVAR